jgi:predicted amidohydrolase
MCMLRRPFEVAAAAASEPGAISALPPPLGLTLGLTTCYDMRFPEVRALRFAPQATAT